MSNNQTPNPDLTTLDREALLRMVGELRGELHQIDQALARRPALDDCKTRAEKVWRACGTAATLDRQLADARGYEIRFKALEPKLKDCESALAAARAEVERLTSELAEAERMFTFAANKGNRHLESLRKARADNACLRAVLAQVGEAVKARAVEIASYANGREDAGSYIAAEIESIDIAAIGAASTETTRAVRSNPTRPCCPECNEEKNLAYIQTNAEAEEWECRTCRTVFQFKPPAEGREAGDGK